MDILQTIVAYKHEQVAEKKQLYPIALLEKSIYFHSKTISLKQYIKRKDKMGIIAEIKRRSPSKGNINPYCFVERFSMGYMQAGASALSILTDDKYFGGSNEDLTIARKFNFCPILRKDFILYEYQIIEAKSIGADAILLIAKILTKEEIRNLAKCAHSLGLEVLLEVHNAEEIEKALDADIDVFGINNRNLEDFSVDIATSLSLIHKIPREVVKISESGINSAAVIMQLRQAGFHGFLIGEYFMKDDQPQRVCESLIKETQYLESQHDKVTT